MLDPFPNRNHVLPGGHGDGQGQRWLSIEKIELAGDVVVRTRDCRDVAQVDKTPFRAAHEHLFDVTDRIELASWIDAQVLVRDPHSTRI